jgi:hypothetical protein
MSDEEPMTLEEYMHKDRVDIILGICLGLFISVFVIVTLKHYGLIA